MIDASRLRLGAWDALYLPVKLAVNWLLAGKTNSLDTDIYASYKG